MGLNVNSFRQAMPIASRMLNPRELLITGVLTRMGVGLLRIEENFPTARRKPQLTREQKFASFFERIFMEAIGVPFQVMTMYLLQEPMATLFEKSRFLQLPTSADFRKEPFNVRAHRHAIIDAIRSTYNPQGVGYPRGIIAKQIYERDAMLAKVGDVKRAYARAMGKRGIQEIPKEVIGSINRLLMGYHRRLWIASVVTLGVGILGSAVLSGYVLQWLNDYPVSKTIIPWFQRQFGISPKIPYRQVFLPGPLPADDAQRTFRL